MKTWLHILLFATFFTNEAFAGGFSNVIATPINPGVNDSIKISYTYTTVSNPAKIFAHQIQINDSDIYVNICFWKGVMAQGISLYDTINLGVFPTPGNFHVTFYMNITTLQDTLCLNSHWYDSVQTNFTISNLNSIKHNIAEREIYLFPNPATNQLNISIDESLIGAQLNIYNVTGSLVQSAQLQIANSKFEIQNLPSGVYVAMITTPKSPKGNFNTVMRRWVKL